MLFSYKALKDGKVVKDKTEADNEKAVLDYLTANGFFPIEIKIAKLNQLTIFQTLFDRVSFDDIVDFTRQLAIMLNAGLTIIDSLETLKKQITKPKLRALLEDIEKRIKGGTSFSAVLGNYPQHFPHLYVALVKSGEASGKLGEILLTLSESLEKQRELRGKLKGALIYPTVVVSAMVSVMFLIITFVVPRMLSLYKDFNITLPLTTQILIAVSNFTSLFWPLIIGFVVGGIFLLRRYIKTKQGKYMFDSFLFKTPIISNIIKKAALVDSTNTLAILTGAGVPILESLNIIIETTNNSIFRNAFENVYKHVEKGQSLGNALAAEEVFPQIFIQMAIVGENTGHLDETLAKLSHYFEFESEAAIKTATTLIEPTVLVLLGVGVAFIVLSVITPIYQLTEAFNK